MSILSAQTIRKLCTGADVVIHERHYPLVSPFVERAMHAETGLSYGLSSCGYDVRLDWGLRDLDGRWIREERAMDPLPMALVRPSSVMSLTDLYVHRGLPVRPGQMVLAATVERFSLPFNLCMRVLDKSSLARLGITVQNTIAEPGWRGYLTLEICNHSGRTHCLTPGQPIAQVVFETLDVPTEQPYPEKGKYQDQARGPQPSRRET